MVETGRDLFESIAEKMKLSADEKRAAAELILLNPDLLLAQYKNGKELSPEAERYEKEGNPLVAENRFATALKLALYEGKLDLAKKYLKKCVTLNQTNNSAYNIASSHFDSVSRVVMEFYKAKSAGASNQ